MVKKSEESKNPKKEVQSNNETTTTETASDVTLKVRNNSDSGLVIYGRNEVRIKASSETELTLSASQAESVRKSLATKAHMIILEDSHSADKA